MSPWTSRVITWSVAILIAGACCALAYTRGGFRIRAAAPVAPLAAGIASGDERVLLYFGASKCTPANDSRLPDSIATITGALVRSSSRDARRLVRIGVAIDMDVDLGLAHLKRIGRFDEIVSGHGWANEAVLKYVSGDINGPAATPQVVVIDRHVRNDDSGQAAVTNEKVRVRKVGVTAIRQWGEQGAPLWE